MKGKKLRALALLLLAALLLTGCGKGNPSVLELPESTPDPDGSAQEAQTPLVPIGNKTCRVGQETIPESTLFSFILDDADFDPQQGLTLQFTSANKSPARDFTVSLEYLAVNGYMQDTGYEASVPAGQTVAGQIRIPAEDLRLSGVSSLDELILYPWVYDANVPEGQGDVVNGAFSFYPSGQSAGNVTYPVRQKTATEQVFFDNSFASVVILGAQTDGEGLLIRCYLENKTERLLSFSWSDAAVNGTPVSFTESTVNGPLMRRYITLSVPVADPADSGEVSFRISATPLTGENTAPLAEQRGTYRYSQGTGAGVVPAGTPASGTDPNDEPVIADVPATATPAPTPTIYTTPTAAQKKNAKNGYINKDKVNLRAGPGTKYKTVGTKIEQNTAVTLYELQDGWWFLKCGSHYGYVKADYVSQGKPKAAEKDDKTYSGEVNTSTKAALRKSADKESKCLKELSDGTKVTVYYKTKGKDGHTWYYVAVGKTKGFIRSDLVKVSGKVPTK